VIYIDVTVKRSADVCLFDRYDGHRDAILRGDDSVGQKDSSAGTTVDDLMGYFSISQYRGYNDDPKVKLLPLS
jgi:hypothetical protein